MINKCKGCGRECKDNFCGIKCASAHVQMECDSLISDFKEIWGYDPIEKEENASDDDCEDLFEEVPNEPSPYLEMNWENCNSLI